MKFKKTLIPVLTGVSNLKNYLESNKLDDNFCVYAVSPGVNCLIANGFVCDENGIPFRNKEFQEKFSWFSEKLKNSNFIGIGKVTWDQECNHRNSIAEKVYQTISYDRSWTSLSCDGIIIEMIDIHQPISNFNIQLKTRLQVMEAMARVPGILEQTVVVQKKFTGVKSNDDSVVEFARHMAKRGKTIMIRNLSSGYEDDDQDGIPANIEFNLFEVLEAKIESVRMSEQFSNIRDKIVQLVDFIRIRYNGELYPISMMQATSEHSYYIGEIISSGKIDLDNFMYKFKAININGKLELITKL